MLQDGEATMHEGPTSVGWGRGWLTLTDRRILLQDWGRSQVLRSIELADIIGYGRTARVGWLQAVVPVVPLISLAMRNALGIRTQDGRTTVFVVRNPDLWIDRMKQGTNTPSSAAGGVRTPTGAAILTALGGFVAWSVVLLAMDQVSAPTGTSGIPMCDSKDARAALADAYEGNASQNLATLRLLDLRDVIEVRAGSEARHCAGLAVLNSGEERIGYELSLSTTGDLLVRVGEPPAQAAADAPPPEPDETETWDEARAYFSTVGVSKWVDNRPDLAGVQTMVNTNAQTDARLQGWSFTVVAVAAVEDDTIYVLAETLRVGQDAEDCHVCAPSLSVLELKNVNNDWVLADSWLNFGEIGAYGHAEALAVELPGSGLGFAIPVSSGMGGVYESSCTIYQLTPGGPRVRADLSKAPSSDQPFACE